MFARIFIYPVIQSHVFKKCMEDSDLFLNLHSLRKEY